MSFVKANGPFQHLPSEGRRNFPWITCALQIHDKFALCMQDEMRMELRPTPAFLFFCSQDNDIPSKMTSDLAQLRGTVILLKCSLGAWLIASRGLTRRAWDR